MLDAKVSALLLECIRLLLRRVSIPFAIAADLVWRGNLETLSAAHRRHRAIRQAVQRRARTRFVEYCRSAPLIFFNGYALKQFEFTRYPSGVI